MTTLVHIADAKSIASIRKSGIRPVRPQRLVYFMPVVQSHLISHQWLRELRRRGVRTMVGVYFQLPKTEMIWAGRYNQTHDHLPLSEAVGLLHRSDDPLGFEMFIERTIRPVEIHAIRALPQTIGWRYHPAARGNIPCPCPACQRGQIRAQRIRVLDERSERESFDAVMIQMENIATPNEDLPFWRLRDKRRQMAPTFLERFLHSSDPDVVLELALTLPFLRHRKSREMLQSLATNQHEHISQAALDGLKTWSG